MRRPTALISVVAVASLTGCGGSLASPDGATASPDGAASMSDSRLSLPDGSLSLPDRAPGDALRGGMTCAQEVPALMVPGTACLYAIPDPACDYVDFSHIGVRVDGSEIARDPSHADGWDYAEATLRTFQIFGPRCDALTNGSATEVRVVFKIILI